MNGLLISDGVNERIVISSNFIYSDCIKKFLKEVYDYNDTELKRVTYTYVMNGGTFSFNRHQGTYRVIKVCTC